jgi:hypothetical protein
MALGSGAQNGNAGSPLVNHPMTFRPYTGASAPRPAGSGGGAGGEVGRPADIGLGNINSALQALPGMRDQGNHGMPHMPMRKPQAEGEGEGAAAGEAGAEGAAEGTAAEAAGTEAAATLGAGEAAGGLEAAGLVGALL